MNTKPPEDRLADNDRTLLIWCAVLSCFLALTIGISIFGVVTGYDAIGKTNRNALSVAAVAHRAVGLAHDIQEERTQTILRSCEDQNARHKATVLELNSELRQVERHLSHARREQLKVSKRFTVLLISRLEPVQDCAKQLRTDTTASK